MTGAPPNVPVETRVGTSWLGSYAYAWPSATGGSDTARLVSAVEQSSGAKLSVFAGCYQAKSFTWGM